MPKVILLPLDERPVNTKYPQMLAAIAGFDIALPPMAVRGHQRRPADLPAVLYWLDHERREGSDAAIVSADYLAYGNLINARVSSNSAVEALGRIELLEEIGVKMPVHVFSLITRVANSNDNVEEPDYWKEWGTKLHQFSREFHSREIAVLGATNPPVQGPTPLVSLPAQIVADWITRRLRNHTVNLALVDMALRGKISSLLLTSDDTAALGLSTRERDWIGSWIKLLDGAAAPSVQMHPGADEVGSALLAKLVNQHYSAVPKILIRYAIPGDEQLVAPYEDRPVHETVLGQIQACGCEPTENLSDAHIVLGVATPSPRRTDYRPEYLEHDRLDREESYAEFLSDLAQLQRGGKRVALADIAYPNGSDPLLSELLMSSDSPLQLARLAAYGAWNTAGNTLGTVVAQSSCSIYTNKDSLRVTAQQKFLAHRFLEDYGYQQRVRREARAFAEERWGRRDPDPTSTLEVSEVCGFIGKRLLQVLSELQNAGVGVGLSLVHDSIRLPWNRTFEVDFDLA